MAQAAGGGRTRGGLPDTARPIIARHEQTCLRLARGCPGRPSSPPRSPPRSASGWAPAGRPTHPSATRRCCRTPAVPAAARGAGLQPGPRRRPRFTAGRCGPLEPGVHRLHPLPGHLPDHAAAARRGAQGGGRSARDRSDRRSCSSRSTRSATAPRRRRVRPVLHPGTLARPAEHEKLQPFARSLGMVYMQVAAEGGGYTVDHSAIAILDPQGAGSAVPAAARSGRASDLPRDLPPLAGGLSR
jgi:hypothetical protein